MISRQSSVVRQKNFVERKFSALVTSNNLVGNRIAVVGASGSGKTTFARQLAQRLGYPHTEIDSLHWQPHWTEAPPDIFRARVDQATAGECWVIDGNYSKVRDIYWRRADTIVWLDYSLPIIFWRLCWRSLKRIITREKLWNNNHETWRAIFGKESLFLWVLASRPRHQRDYPRLFQQPEYAHLRVVRLHSPRETERWLERINVNT